MSLEKKTDFIFDPRNPRQPWTYVQNERRVGHVLKRRDILTEESLGELTDSVMNNTGIRIKNVNRLSSRTTPKGLRTKK